MTSCLLIVLCHCSFALNILDTKLHIINERYEKIVENYLKKGIHDAGECLSDDYYDKYLLFQDYFFAVDDVNSLFWSRNALSLKIEDYFLGLDVTGNLANAVGYAWYSCLAIRLYISTPKCSLTAIRLNSLNRLQAATIFLLPITI